VIYSSLGDSSVAKEYIEVFTDGRVVQLDDFHRLSISRCGKTSRSKTMQDKGQGALVTAFLAAANGGGPPPIPLSDIVAATEATFAIQEALRVGSGVTLTRSAHGAIVAEFGVAGGGRPEQR
jgi:polar amino acid transport system substrate-binding protein